MSPVDVCAQSPSTTPTPNDPSAEDGLADVLPAPVPPPAASGEEDSASAPSLQAPDQQALDRMAQATGAASVAPRASARLFDDHGSAAVPWNDRDPALEPLPEGVWHLGVQVAATIATGPPDITFGGELAPYLDIRFDLRMHLRIAAVVGIQNDLGHGNPLVQPSLGNGVFFTGGRVLFGLVGRGFAFRFGGEAGAEFLSHSADEVSAYGGGLIEFATRALEDERLEILSDFAFQDRSFSQRAPAFGPPLLIVQDDFSFRFGLGLGVVL